MAEGNNYQQSCADTEVTESEIWLSPVDLQTPYDSFNNILASEAQQVESIEDIFHTLSNVDLHPPYPPPPSPLLPLVPPTSDQQRETQQQTNKEYNSSRKRPSEGHNLIERKRRSRIQEKLNTLQQLTPNCNKTSKVSTLSNVIEYIKSLQKQVEMMPPMGIPVMPPYVPNPAGGQQSMQVPYFPPPLVPMAPVMGMGYGMGVYGPQTSFSNDFPLFTPPFPLPSSTNVGKLGAVQVNFPHQKMPFQSCQQVVPATLTSATSMTTTRSHDVGGASPSASATRVSPTTMTMISSQVAEATADGLYQISETFQGPFRGPMSIAGTSQLVRPFSRGNP